MDLFGFFSRDGRITLLVAALVLSACTEEGADKKKDPKKKSAEVQKDHGAQAEKGAFALTVPEEASGLLDILAIKVLDQNGGVVSDQKIEVKGGESLSFPLDVGSYKVTVEAFLKDVLMFTGSGSTEIKVGEKSLLDITMVAAEGAQAAGQGELEIRLKLPGMSDQAGGADGAGAEDDVQEDDGQGQGQDDAMDDGEDDGQGDQGEQGDQGDQDGQGDQGGQDETVQEEAGQDAGSGAGDDDGAVVKSIVGEWRTDYSVLGATHVDVKADAAGKMTISDDSGKPAITVDYTFADGVLFISNMKTDDESRHLARTVKKNIGRSIDVTKAANGALEVEILLPSGFIRTKSFVKPQ